MIEFQQEGSDTDGKEKPQMNPDHPYDFRFRPAPPSSRQCDIDRRPLDDQFRDIVNYNWTPEEEMSLMRFSALMD